MKYEKPEVALLGPAIGAIESQSCSKPHSVTDHSSGCGSQNSSGAYEADE